MHEVALDKNRGAFLIRKGSFSKSRGVTQSRFEKRQSKTFAFVRVFIKGWSWLRLIKRAGSKGNTFSCKG